ncbi:hypothetical protein SUGI_0295300 [Cryptomeria japonica]|nr:hypothetical protein SUGI_0295300 [Cryptomeria japonica]
MNGSASPALMGSDVCKQLGFCDLPTDSIFLQQLGNTELRFVSKDKHLLTEEGRDRRARLPRECALKLYPLTRKLGYKWDGETVEWLFKQSYHAIKALMSDDNKEDSSKKDISAQFFNNVSPCIQAYHNYLSRNAFGSCQSQLQEQQSWSTEVPLAHHTQQGFPPLSTNYGNYDHLSYNSRGLYQLPQHDICQLLAQQQAQYMLMMDITGRDLKSSKTRSECIQ